VKLFSWQDFWIGFGVGLVASILADVIDSAAGAGLRIGMAAGFPTWKTPSFWADVMIGFLVGYTACRPALGSTS
jgi:hypothetical protein